LFGPYLPLFVEAGTKSGAASMTGIINGITGLMTALSGLTISRLGDRHDKMAMIKLLLTLGVVASIPLGFTSSLWVFAFIYGLVFFIIGGIEPVVVSITTERTPVEKRGTLFGIQGLVGNIGWIVSPVVASYVSIRFSIQSVLFLIPLSIIPALAALLIFRRKLAEKAAASGSKLPC
jgi:DHA1 family multidrug resistance protein-like MFS transporter